MTAQTFQRATLVALLVLLIYFDYRILESFLVPLTWAVILTIFFYPVHRRVLAKIPKPNLAALATVSVVTIVLVVPGVLFTGAFVREAAGLLRGVSPSDLAPKAESLLDRLGENLPVDGARLRTRASDVAESAGTYLAQLPARAAGGVAQFVFYLIIIFFAMFYLFRDGPAMVGFLQETGSFTTETSELIATEIGRMVSVTITSNFVVAFAQGSCAAFSFWILGMPSPFFWGVVSAVICLLPLIGPWVVWIPASIYFFAQGSAWKGVAMLALGFFLISGVDNIIRPMFVAGRTELNGLLVVISIFGGIHVFGFVGIVLGPVFAAATVGALRGYRESLRQAQASEAMAEAGD